MLLLAGLGNPGTKFRNNRHNVGFMVLDELVDTLAPAMTRWRQNFGGTCADFISGGQKVLALKPQTFMNRSGRAVAEAVRWYDIPPENVIVFHDELDLPIGGFRLKHGGGHAGHNGLRDIHAHVGEGYRRVRIGIGHPGHKDRVEGYVLGDFSKQDLATLMPLVQAIARHGSLLIGGNDSAFGNAVHEALKPLDK